MNEDFKYASTYECTIHNLNYKYSLRSLDSNMPVRCPYCIALELESLRKEHNKVVKQRNILVEAFNTVLELKSVVAASSETL